MTITIATITPWIALIAGILLGCERLAPQRRQPGQKRCSLDHDGGDSGGRRARSASTPERYANPTASSPSFKPHPRLRRIKWASRCHRKRPPAPEHARPCPGSPKVGVANVWRLNMEESERATATSSPAVGVPRRGVGAEGGALHVGRPAGRP